MQFRFSPQRDKDITTCESYFDSVGLNNLILILIQIIHLINREPNE